MNEELDYELGGLIEVTSSDSPGTILKIHLSSTRGDISLEWDKGVY